MHWVLEPHPTSPSSDGTVDDLACCFRLWTTVCDLLKCCSLRAAMPIIPYEHGSPLRWMGQEQGCWQCTYSPWGAAQHEPSTSQHGEAAGLATRLRPSAESDVLWHAIPNIAQALLMLRLLLRDSTPRRALHQGVNFASLYTTQLNRLASGKHQACEPELSSRSRPVGCQKAALSPV